MMPSMGSQLSPVHVYILNIYISMYQNIMLTIKTAEAQSTSFTLLYLPNTSGYKDSFICSHTSVIFEKQSSLVSLQVMITTFAKKQNFLKSSIEMNPKLSYSSADEYIKRQICVKSSKPGKSFSL